jgi:uncharacterized protein (TIGR00369 family)
MPTTNRHRSYAWEDQTPTRTAGATQDGLAVLHAIGRDDLPLPPALRTLDIRPHEAEPGQVSFLLTPAEFHLNPFGVVHGGVLAALLDTAMGCAVHSLLPAGSGYLTAELNVRYLRPVLLGSGSLLCVGHVVRPGRRSMVVQARIVEDSGREVAIAGATCLVVEPA